MIRDKYFNHMEALDLITYDNMEGIITNSKIEIIIGNFWRGPYEFESFLESSTSYKIIRDTFSENNSFVVKSTKRYFKDESVLKHKKVAKKANFFSYVQWVNSISLVYFIDAVFTIILAMMSLFYISRMLTDFSNLYTQFQTLQAYSRIIVDPDSTASEIAAANASFTALTPIKDATATRVYNRHIF